MGNTVHKDFGNGWTIISTPGNTLYQAMYQGSVRRIGYDLENLEDFIAHETKQQIAPRWRNKPQEYGTW